jgi:hypothetical protein
MSGICNSGGPAAAVPDHAPDCLCRDCVYMRQWHAWAKTQPEISEAFETVIDEKEKS